MISPLSFKFKQTHNYQLDMEHGDYLNYDPNWPTINMTYLHPQPAVELGNFRYALMFKKNKGPMNLLKSVS